MEAHFGTVKAHSGVTEAHFLTHKARLGVVEVHLEIVETYFRTVKVHSRTVGSYNTRIHEDFFWNSEGSFLQPMYIVSRNREHSFRNSKGSVWNRGLILIARRIISEQ